MNKYRLSPSCDYVALFKSTPIDFFSPEKRRPLQRLRFGRRPQRGVVEINDGKLDFEIHLRARNSVVPPGDIAFAQQVLAQVAEMDSAARELPQRLGMDHEEYLAYITIAPPKVVLRYCAAAFNTEWSAHFVPGKSGRYQLVRLG